MATATRATVLPAWATAFQTPEEVNGPVTDVEGRVPDGLAGTLYRVGPGKLDLAHHLFDGDGLVSAVRFDPSGRMRSKMEFSTPSISKSDSLKIRGEVNARQRRWKLFKELRLEACYRD